MNDKTFKIVNGDMSDGYHTFDELYEHRIALFLALCKSRGPEYCVWREDPNAPGWVIVYLDLAGPISLELSNKQISYHIPESSIPEWMEHCTVMQWDGHTPADVVRRLTDWTNDQRIRANVPTADVRVE